jgi:poly(A) polymerase Pap1
MAKFIKLYQIIKKWAKNRQIYGANYGYFNGITWLTLILNLFIKKENMELSKKEFIKEFFRYYDTYDWKIPINISNIKYEGHTPVDHMAILVNICPPSQNIIRGISETTWNIIKDEFARAHRLGDDVDKLFDKRKLTGHVCTITICDPYKFNVLKHKNLIMSNIWKLCIATNGVNPICSWKLSEHNAVYKFGISASTDCGVINSHFKGIDCSISFI